MLHNSNYMFGHRMFQIQMNRMQCTRGAKQVTDIIDIA